MHDMTLCATRLIDISFVFALIGGAILLRYSIHSSSEPYA